MQKVLAMILAGGRGQRMDLLCHCRPKPVLPFAGKFRVIDFTLSNCVHSGIEEVAILADYERSQMADYVRRWDSLNGATASFHIWEPGTGSYAGTADAVYQNLERLQECGVDRVLILAGDHIYKMDYRQMLAFHEETKADLTVGVVHITLEQASRFGTVKIESDGRVAGFAEKSRTPQGDFASMGIYVFNTGVMARRLREDAAQQGSPHDFGYAIIPRMVEWDRVYGFKFGGYWQDIGTIEAYYAANMGTGPRQAVFLP